jgi:putative SOS response-associated peptidase YedK
MCGRFIQITDPLKIKAIFHDLEVETCVEEQFKPHYNVSPTLAILTILNTPVPRLTFTRWGLIPYWSKEKEIGSRMMNARAETLPEKPSFRELFRKRRCVILADGFYEWDSIHATKIPYFIRMKNREPFALAGLWDLWKDPKTRDSILSSTIITTVPNPLIAQIHNRMPAIIREDRLGMWLNPGPASGTNLMECLQSYNQDDMEMYKVSMMVNNTRNDSPELIVPA